MTRSDPARVAAAPTDVQLIDALRGGDTTALASLYDRHAAVMLAIAQRTLRDRAAAEDLVHDTFIEAWRAIDAYDPARGTVRGWLLLRIRSRAIDALRRGQRRQVMQRQIAAYESLDSPPSAVDHELLQAAVQQLPRGARVVVERVYLGGLTCREASRALALPVGTVKSRLRAAKTQLRRSLASSAVTGVQAA